MQNSDPKSTAPADSRREKRKRILLRARIVFPDGKVFVDCTIVDASLSGAQIRINQRHNLPPSFYLINVRDHTAHEATVVWSNAGLAGVHFEATHSLGIEIAPELSFLKKHWIECATR